MSNPNYGGVLNTGVAQGCVASPAGLGQLGGNPHVHTIGGMAAQSTVPAKPEITHIEIRRVQNGFVVMALNMKVYEAALNQPQRWSYVAKDTAELGALLTSIVDGGVDLEWIPSYDLPIIDLTRRVPEK